MEKECSSVESNGDLSNRCRFKAISFEDPSSATLLSITTRRAAIISSSRVSNRCKRNSWASCCSKPEYCSSLVASALFSSEGSRMPYFSRNLFRINYRNLAQHSKKNYRTYEKSFVSCWKIEVCTFVDPSKHFLS